MLVSQQNFGHLLRPITQCGKGLHIAGDILACIDCSRFIRHFFRCSRRKAGIHQNDFVSGINQIVGEAGAILDGVIKFFGSFFSAENKRLCGKTVFSEIDCFDFHNISSLQQCFYAGFYVRHVSSWLKASCHIAVTVNDEFGEVLFNVRLLVPVRIGLGTHLFQQRLIRMLTKSPKAFLCLQIGVERQLIFAVHVRFFDLRERGVEVHALAHIAAIFL